MALLRANALCVMCALVLLLAVISEGAKIETFNVRSCSGAPTNTFYVGGNTCQRFNDQSAVRISEVSGGTRISVHNQRNCQGSSSVAQIYGGGCVVQGGTKLRAVWIQG